VREGVSSSVPVKKGNGRKECGGRKVKEGMEEGEGRKM
jgi:hypothetical protein